MFKHYSILSSRYIPCSCFIRFGFVLISVNVICDRMNPTITNLLMKWLDFLKKSYGKKASAGESFRHGNGKEGNLARPLSWWKSTESGHFCGISWRNRCPLATQSAPVSLVVPGVQGWAPLHFPYAAAGRINHRPITFGISLTLPSSRHMALVQVLARDNAPHFPGVYKRILQQVTLIGALLLAGALAGLPPGSFSYKVGPFHCTRLCIWTLKQLLREPLFIDSVPKFSITTRVIISYFFVIPLFLRIVHEKRRLK